MEHEKDKNSRRLTARDKGYAYFPRCFEDPCFGGGCTNDHCDFMRRVCEALAWYEENAGGWISVRDALPDDQEEVLVCTQSKNGVRNIDKGYWSIDQFIHRGRAAVTHWMPLPGFPDEE